MGYDWYDEMKWGWELRTVPKEDGFWMLLLRWVIARLIVVGVFAGLIALNNVYREPRARSRDRKSLL